MLASSREAGVPVFVPAIVLAETLFCDNRRGLRLTLGSFAASRAVALRSGFEFEGVSRSFRHLHGVATDFASYSLRISDL